MSEPTTTPAPVTVTLDSVTLARWERMEKMIATLYHNLGIVQKDPLIALDPKGAAERHAALVKQVNGAAA